MEDKDKPYTITHVPQQLGNDSTSNQMEEMERTLSYLEAMAFARNYQSILAGLRFTRLVLQCDKYPSEQATAFKKKALATLDDAYRILKQQFEELDESTQQAS